MEPDGVHDGAVPAGPATAEVSSAVAAVGVTKRFAGGVVANDRVSFDALVHPGTAVADFHNTSDWMKARIKD